MAEPQRQGPPRKSAEIIALKKKAAERRRMKQPKPDPEEIKRRTRSNVAALVFAAILVGVGWVLVQKLGEMSRLQDCVMSGRSNCAPIPVTMHQDQ